MLKHAPPEQIIAAIRAAAAGESTVSPVVLHQLINRAKAAPDDDDPLGGLSDREREVALAVAEARHQDAEEAMRLLLSEVRDAMVPLGAQQSGR